MFAGLFVVVAGFEKALLTPELVAAHRRGSASTDMPILSVVTAMLSNLVSNVPAVLVLKPFIVQLADPQRSLACRRDGLDPRRQSDDARLGRQSDRGATGARPRGVTIGFWEYFRVGAPLTLFTIAIGLWWL